jgi:hypothetical protein
MKGGSARFERLRLELKLLHGQFQGLLQLQCLLSNLGYARLDFCGLLLYHFGFRLDCLQVLLMRQQCGVLLSHPVHVHVSATSRRRRLSLLLVSFRGSSLTLQRLGKRKLALSLGGNVQAEIRRNGLLQRHCQVQGSVYGRCTMYTPCKSLCNHGIVGKIVKVGEILIFH